MAVVAGIGGGCNVIVKHTFWELEDGEMEEVAAQRPRAFTDSALFRLLYSDATTDDDDANCMLSETLSADDTDAGSSVGESNSRPSSFLWSDSDEEETTTLGHPPGTFGCQMPSLQWVPCPVPVPALVKSHGRPCTGEADVKGCRTEVKPQHGKTSRSVEPTKVKQTVLRALKKSRQTLEATQ